MRDATGDVQSILVLGGTSELALAVVRRLVAARCRTVVLAGRDRSGLETVAAGLTEAGPAGLRVDVIDFDAAATDTHAAVIAEAFATHPDLDVVLLAFGVLGDQTELDADPAAAAEVARVNFGGGVSAGLAVAEQLRAQGHGTLVVITSVAGERVRAENLVYGATKAGLDGFAQGLGDHLVGSGAAVMVVRPGFVRTKMTAHLSDGPMATTADAVADDVVAGLRRGASVVWSPAKLRPVFGVLKLLPRPLWRKVSARR